MDKKIPLCFPVAWNGLIQGRVTDSDDKQPEIILKIFEDTRNGDICNRWVKGTVPFNREIAREYIKLWKSDRKTVIGRFVGLEFTNASRTASAFRSIEENYAIDIYDKQLLDRAAETRNPYEYIAAVFYVALTNPIPYGYRNAAEKIPDEELRALESRKYTPVFDEVWEIQTAQEEPPSADETESPSGAEANSAALAVETQFTAEELELFEECSHFILEEWVFDEDSPPDERLRFVPSFPWSSKVWLTPVSLDPSDPDGPVALRSLLPLVDCGLLNRREDIVVDQRRGFIDQEGDFILVFSSRDDSETGLTYSRYVLTPLGKRLLARLKPVENRSFLIEVGREMRNKFSAGYDVQLHRVFYHDAHILSCYCTTDTEVEETLLVRHPKDDQKNVVALYGITESIPDLLDYFRVCEAMLLVAQIATFREAYDRGYRETPPDPEDNPDSDNSRILLSQPLLEKVIRFELQKYFPDEEKLFEHLVDTHQGLTERLYKTLSRSRKDMTLYRDLIIMVNQEEPFCHLPVDGLFPEPKPEDTATS